MTTLAVRSPRGEAHETEKREGFSLRIVNDLAFSRNHSTGCDHPNDETTY